MTDAPTLVNGNVNYNEITFIDYANNRVGINTAVPEYELDVNGSTYSKRYLFGTSPSVYQRLDYNAGGYGYWTTTTGTEVLYVNNSGNVGIGTNNPATKLSVNGTTSTTTALVNGASAANIFTVTGFAYAPSLASQVNSSLTYSTGFNFSPALDISNLDLTNGNSTYLSFSSINSGGSRVSGAQIGGVFNDHLGSSSFPDTSIVFLTGYNGAAPSERFRITSAGDVGIGTTTPSSKLDLWNGALTLHNNDSSKYTTIQTLSNNFATFQDPAGFNWIEYDNPNRKLTLGGLASQDSARLWIVSNGNVGMGTSTPATKLHVYGGDFRLDNGTGYQSFSAGSSYGVWKTQSGTESITVNQSSAYTGIGTNAPTNQLTVGTGADAGAGVPTGIVKLQGAGASGTLTHVQVGSVNGPALYAKSGIGGALSSDAALQFEVNRSSTATVAMTIASNSNIGIGTNTPAYKLDIAGDLNLSGRFYPGNLSAVSLTNSFNFTNSASTGNWNYVSSTRIYPTMVYLVYVQSLAGFRYTKAFIAPSTATDPTLNGSIPGGWIELLDLITSNLADGSTNQGGSFYVPKGWKYCARYENQFGSYSQPIVEVIMF